MRRSLRVAFADAPAPAWQTIPAIDLASSSNLRQLPPDTHFGEVSGVAANSKGHIFAVWQGALNFAVKNL